MKNGFVIALSLLLSVEAFASTDHRQNIAKCSHFLLLAFDKIKAGEIAETVDYFGDRISPELKGRLLRGTLDEVLEIEISVPISVFEDRSSHHHDSIAIPLLTRLTFLNLKATQISNAGLSAVLSNEPIMVRVSGTLHDVATLFETFRIRDIVHKEAVRTGLIPVGDFHYRDYGDLEFARLAN